MRDLLFRASLIFLALYTMVPWILTRILGLGVFRRGEGQRRIALTFDDGPDPAYTPQLLDLLRRHGVTATFFVLGRKAEKHPELIRRIHGEGHQLGIHNYTHLSNWLMTPWTVRRKQVNRSADIVEAITGVRPTCYRPPWGIINLCDFRLRKDYTIVLWSLMAHDWRRSVGANRLKEFLLRKAKDGSVVLLHDSGETFGADRDAPAAMLKALDAVIDELKRRGFEFVRVDAMLPAGRRQSEPYNPGIAKRLLIRVWMVWEWCFLKLFHIEPVDTDNPLLKLRVREYSGRSPIVLSDGEEIRKGDRIVELHLDNGTLYKMGASALTSVHLAIQLIRRMEQLLPQVGKLLQTNPLYRDVKGLYGISIIHRGTRQLGFTVIDLPDGVFALATKLYLRLLLYIVHPKGKDRLKTNAEKLVPKIIAISKKELMNRYAA